MQIILIILPVFQLMLTIAGLDVNDSFIVIAKPKFDIRLEEIKSIYIGGAEIMSFL